MIGSTPAVVHVFWQSETPYEIEWKSGMILIVVCFFQQADQNHIPSGDDMRRIFSMRCQQYVYSMTVTDTIAVPGAIQCGYYCPFSATYRAKAMFGINRD